MVPTVATETIFLSNSSHQDHLFISVLSLCINFVFQALSSNSWPGLDRKINWGESNFSAARIKVIAATEFSGRQKGRLGE